jgi:hypothetical protein
MALTKLQFSPGVNKEGTDYTADQGWYESDKIRFRQGRPEKIGGWQKFSTNSFLGVCRSLHRWASLAFTKYIGIGTHLKFYISEGNSFNDVTPIRLTTSAGDPRFAATDGSSVITVTEADHGAVVNDFVTFTSAVTLGGTITATVLNQEQEITSVTSSSVYTFTAKDTSGTTVTANSSDSGDGGSSTVGNYQINTGLNAYVYHDTSGGVGTRAVDITSIAGNLSPPSIALQVMVSDIDQHVIAFGSNPIGSSAIDPLFIRFSDQQNAIDWLPTATNTAGGVRINSGSIIIGAVQAREEILVFTDASLHSMRFVGPPFVFNFATISTDTSMISPNAAVNARGSVFFMDEGGFFVYNGSVQPLPCSVKDYVFSNLNVGQAFKVFAAENSAHSEVTWYYPIGSGTTEITNYVTYNYEENLWSVGTLTRGAWFDSGLSNFPLATSIITDTNANYMYEHENGYDADGEALTAFVESGDLEIGDGNSFMFMNRIIPDFSFKGTDPSVSMTIKGKDYPLQDASVLATTTVTSSTGQSVIRARSRHPSIRIESTGEGYGWRLGTLRMDVRQDGRR